MSIGVRSEEKSYVKSEERDVEELKGLAGCRRGRQGCGCAKSRLNIWGDSVCLNHSMGICYVADVRVQ